MLYKEDFGEGKNIEFKREIPKRHEKLLKDVIAFSNSTGGKIFIGIEDKTNEVIGIGEKNPFRLADDISNMIFDSCTPIIDPEITIQTLEGRTVVVVEVFPGRMRPYYLKSFGKEQSSYIRINGTSRPADDRKLKELELEGQKISYDTLPEIDMEYSEREAKILCNAMEKVAYDVQTTCVTRAIQETSLDSEQNTEKTEIINKMTIEKLEDLGLLCRIGKELQPTHAFRLMTKNKIRYAKIQCALFKGTERDIFIDKREFDGPLYIQLEDAYRFVLKHINLGAKIEGLHRKEAYELPVRTIRELITNAIVHRSYLDESCIQVCVYDDRIEVTSPGMLYGGLDMQSAKSGKSKCRNTAIAESFRYMGLIEAWGTGIPRMIKECREYGLREPMFEELGDSIRVTIFRENEELEIRKRAENIQNTGNKYQYMNNINSENLASVVKEQTVEYEEQNHCFNIEKPLFDTLNSQENSESYYLKMKKPLFNALNSQENEKNHCLNDDKSLFETSVSTAENKYMLYKKLEELQVNKSIGSVTALNIKAIIETFSGQEIFGRKEIKQKLGYKDSKAGFLIQIMKEIELIKAVEGRGKGKYRFAVIYRL
nr:ATP-binding protein [uncultured Anaerobutyricum sp.]